MRIFLKDPVSYFSNPLLISKGNNKDASEGNEILMKKSRQGSSLFEKFS